MIVGGSSSGCDSTVNVNLNYHVLNEMDFVDSVSRNLRLGKFLLIIAGDGIREGAKEISEFLNKSASLNFTMAIVEMPIYQSDDNEIVLFPRTTVKTTEIQKINIEIPEGLKLVENSVELIPDNSSSEVSEETKERRKYFTKFWTEYIDQLQLDDPSQSLPNPTRTQNLYIYPGIDKSTWISAYFAQSTGQVGVYYRFSSNQRGQNSREQLYPYLNEIRKELGDKVKWYWDDNINSAFGIVLPLSDVYDQENKKKITGFFNEWVNKFINSIRPRLKQIE